MSEYSLIYENHVKGHRIFVGRLYLAPWLDVTIFLNEGDAHSFISLNRSDQPFELEVLMW